MQLTNKQQKTKNHQHGSMIVMTLVFTFLFISIISGILSLLTYQNRLTKIQHAQESALQVAEAGINYYRWHLAHAESDYADGCNDVNPTASWCTGGGVSNNCANPNACGPYEHDYYDYAGTTKIGAFKLSITPPPIGSTMITISSEGWVEGFANQSRTIEVRYGIPSLAQYSVAANNFIRFGSGTTTYGPMHSNSGLRFDGLAYNIVTSSVADFNDPDHEGDNEFGVHTHVTPTDPLPPADVPARPDVFSAGRNFPVPIIDFNNISADLSALLTDATADTACNINSGGCVLEDSGASGWHIELLSNSTFRYRTVNSTSTCDSGTPTGEIATSSSWITQNMPNNLIIFVKDDLWIDGTIDGDRVTVVAGTEPLTSGNAKIWINNDVLYTTKDGTDVIGLIAQDDISLGLYSTDNLEVDAALIAQNGRIGREYYPSSCSGTYYKRNFVEIYGTIITFQRYGFKWGCPDYCSGYDTRDLVYDNNLTYSPPPSFPTTGQYTFISWEEK